MEVLNQVPMPTVTSTGEELLGNHLVLNDISWETYSKLLEIFSDRSIPRITYYQGTLELKAPLREHEIYSWSLGQLIVALREEMDLEIAGFRSSTWRSQPKATGKEADECFYIQNEGKVRNKLEIDLSVDPPPDLAIEVDLTHSSIDAMSVYAELEVPEVWLWRKGKLTINLLKEDGYVESETSLAFGSFPVKEITQFMKFDSDKGHNAKMREFRQWVRANLPQ
ncbi:MAG: Uma2 family endonuclease [Cyanobacteriota bacterium]|nr:Uma2 family endonuclease [Cyanobacteriota bacterium]